MAGMQIPGVKGEGEGISKLFFKAVLAAARGDKERTYEIMCEVLKELDKA